MSAVSGLPKTVTVRKPRKAFVGVGDSAHRAVGA